MNSLKQSIIDEKLNKVKRKINLFKNHMNINTIYNQKNSSGFDEKLALFQTQKTNINQSEVKNYDNLDEINEREFKKHKVMMEDIRQKLDERMKSKKDKEKRERQQLKEEKFTSRSYSVDRNKEMEKNNNIVRKSLYKNINISSINENEEIIKEGEKINDMMGTTTSKFSTYSR